MANIKITELDAATSPDADDLLEIVEDGNSRKATTVQVFNAGKSGFDGQLPFPASQNASADANTLDDYEEGTWTPAITFVTPGDLNVVYSSQIGRYTKIGRVVTAHFTLVTSTFTHSTASGDLRISTLPVAADNATNYIGTASFAGITKAGYTQFNLRTVLSALTQMVLTGYGSGVAGSNVAAADMPTGGTVTLQGTITYIV